MFTNFYSKLSFLDAVQWIRFTTGSKTLQLVLERWETNNFCSKLWVSKVILYSMIFVQNCHIRNEFNGFSKKRSDLISYLYGKTSIYYQLKTFYDFLIYFLIFFWKNFACLFFYCHSVCNRYIYSGSWDSKSILLCSSVCLSLCWKHDWDRTGGARVTEEGTNISLI